VWGIKYTGEVMPSGPIEVVVNDVEITIPECYGLYVAMRWAWWVGFGGVALLILIAVISVCILKSIGDPKTKSV